jgi:hypothetical protein
VERTFAWISRNRRLSKDYASNPHHDFRSIKLRADLTVEPNSISTAKPSGQKPSGDANTPLHIRSATNDDLAILAQLNEPVLQS